MAAHRQIDGVYQWELTLPPASAAALLSAVCVDLGSAKPHYLAHLLWGPKSWTIRFDGSTFELRPLGRGGIYTSLGIPCGMLVPTKAGSRIELRQNGDESQRQLLRWFPIIFPPIIAVWLVVFAPPDFSIWIRIPLALAIVGWFIFGFRWLMPWMARTTYTDFIDDLFADYVAHPSAEKKLPSPANVPTAGT
jgi:hypothetical protein